MNEFSPHFKGVFIGVFGFVTRLEEATDVPNRSLFSVLKSGVYINVMLSIW
jgi:hypothetical protein